MYAGLDPRIFEMAGRNLQIPGIRYMGYTPDVHVGVGTCIGTTAVWDQEGGMVSPSIVGSDIGCGMRVHLTNLHRSDIQDLRLRRKLVNRIEKYLPMEAHKRGAFSDLRMDHIVQKGLKGLPSKYLPESVSAKRSPSLTHAEHARFAFDPEELNAVSDNYWVKGLRQLGTLGGGNHFAEIQYIEIAEENRAIAEQWGLRDGQVVVMVHSGSRAWGAMVSQHYTSMAARAMTRLGLGTDDPRLVFAPLDSPEGRRYTDMMASALNVAVVNRHLIAYAIREAFLDVFGSKFEMNILYDLMHNYAWEERHGERDYFVHRKGATRALPPGHPDNPAVYRDTGHPALIPGSMGTASYIMAGLPGGVDNYHSICHGAGRIRSRTATKKSVTVDEFAAALKIGTEEEVIVNHNSLGVILDESPQAYKDVDRIVGSVTGAGLASIVAKCKPLAAVKGAKV
nr:RtcB family protein [Saccharibacillus deserti]